MEYHYNQWVTHTELFVQLTLENVVQAAKNKHLLSREQSYPQIGNMLSELDTVKSPLNVGQHDCF